MKIFITGSTGFIGSNLVQFYKEQEVFEFKRYMPLESELNKFKPDLIINSAAQIYDTYTMWGVNVGLTRTCLEYCKANPNTRLMHMGTSSEYGPLDRASKETDATNPQDMYAGTKSIATTLCQVYGRTYGLDVVVVRPYSPYGPGERPHRLFPALWRAFKLERPMDLVLGVHDFCYIDDFVRAVDIINSSSERTPGEVINVSSGEQTTNGDVLNTFEKIAGHSAPVNVINKFTTPPTWQADITHIKNKYKWTPTISLEQGIKLFLERASYE